MATTNATVARIFSRDGAEWCITGSRGLKERGRRSKSEKLCLHILMRDSLGSAAVGCMREWHSLEKEISAECIWKYDGYTGKLGWII